MLRGLFRSVVLAAVFLSVQNQASADSKSKQVFQAQLQPYINQAQHVANSKVSAVRENIRSWATGTDPIWYGGNLLGVAALAQDFWVNFFHDFPNGFLDCFNFDTGGTCRNSAGIPWGIRVSYRWPLQFIHSRRFFQDRYFPPQLYEALKASGYYENIFYPMVSRLHAPLALNNASVQTAIQMNTKSWAAYIPAHGPIIPNISVASASFPLDQPSERGRYDGGKIGNMDLNQLEYMLAPSLAQSAWYVLVQYFPFLRLLPCAPPNRIALPFGSEHPGMIEMTRNPFLGFALHEDRNLRNDLSEWVKNPAICQEWMMSRQRQNIPHDMYDFNGTLLSNPLSFAIDLASDLAQGGGVNGNGAILAPLPNSQLSRFNRMCTKRWGGSIPFTTVHQLHDTAFIDAGKNFEKAIRLGSGIYESFIRDTPAARYVRYYPLNKRNDAYQLTYHQEWSCKEVGTPGKLFDGADALAKGGEHGLYSMTHWYKTRECCLSFDKVFELLGELAEL